MNRCSTWVRRSVALFELVAMMAALGGRQLGAQGATEPKNWTAAEDHQNMMAQLGIRTLRPGPSGNESAPNHANYDEATANPFPDLPEVLTLKNGTKVTSADTWRTQRRPEIVEDFEREVLGRVPVAVPKVTWSVAASARGMVGRYRAIGRQLVGHVGDSSYSAVTVDIQMTLVTPADATGPVPVMIMFGSGVLPPSLGGPAPQGRDGGRGAPAAVAGADPPAT